MFNFNRIFFIISNFFLSFITFNFIYLIRYSWLEFPGVHKRGLNPETLFLLLCYSLLIIILNITFKIYELNKITRITEAIIYNFIISLFSIGVFSIFFYLTKTDFARFVFFSGFIIVPFTLSIYNKIIFNLLFSRRKIHKLFYLGSQKNYQLFLELIKKYETIFSIQIEKTFLNDDISQLNKKLDNCDFLIIDSDQHFNSRLFEILNNFEICGGRIYTLIDIFAYLDQSLPAEIISNNSHFELFSTYKLDSIYNKITKRIEDIFLSICLLFLCSPLFIITALLIKLSSRGKIFYTQKRSGLNGKEFNILKFRTMKVNSESEYPSLTQKNDNRVTKIGKILRPLRIDELPQLLNILKGEMSFIGPRPERQVIIEEIIKQYPLFKKRLLIKPGLTGWAQVKHSYVNQIEKMNKKLSYDLYYLNNFSIIFDLKILLYTIETIIFKQGAI